MDEAYVTNEAWRRRAVRADAIDEIADQFERPAPGAHAFWVDLLAQRAARDARITPRSGRRAG